MNSQAKSNHHVLIVDDDRTMRALLGAFLRAAGHEVSAAESGEEALVLVGARRPDLVLLDYSLPGMSGLELLCRLRAEPRLDAVPILMLTGRELDRQLEQTLLAGADGYMQKPVDRRSLLARVEVTLRGRAAAGRLAS